MQPPRVFSQQALRSHSLPQQRATVPVSFQMRQEFHSNRQLQQTRGADPQFDKEVLLQILRQKIHEEIQLVNSRKVGREENEK